MMVEALERWSTMQYTPWNIMKYNPIKYDTFLSTPYLRKMSQQDAERFLYSKCAWSRAGGIPGRLIAICAERLGVRLNYEVKRSAVLRSYFDTLYPIASPMAVVSARFIHAKETLIEAIEAHDALETLPLAVCQEYVTATAEHIQAFGAAPPKNWHAYLLEKALFTYADIQRILGQLRPKEKDSRLDKIEKFLIEGGSGAEMAYVKHLFDR
jgi:hypothetical protein